MTITVNVTGLSLMMGCAIALGLSGTAGAAEVAYPSWQWGESANAALLNNVRQEFEKDSSGDTVRPISVPYEGFFDKQYSEVRAGSPSDIVSLFDPEMASYIKQGLLEPLDKYLEMAGVSPDQLSVSHKVAIKDGHVYGVAFQTNPRALLVNGKLLRDAGVSVPTNLDEFLAAIDKLRNPAKQQFGFYSLSASGPAQDAYLQTAPIILGFGGGWFKAGEPTADSPETIAALKFIKKVYDDGLVPRVDSRAAQQMFIDGRIATFIVGPFLVGFAAEQNKETYENIEATIPPFPGKQAAAVTTFLGVPNAAKNKDAAGRFIATLLKPEMQESIVEIVKALPAVKGSIPASFVDRNPWFGAFVEAGDHAVSYAPEGMEEYGPEIYNIIGPAIEEILFNNRDIEQTLKELQAELEQFVAEKNAN
ncbi:sugar ABC transporter substrate-binding protein [Mesorhizobium sp.]|uniref:ABC transporter substrate-binding protein n=1 Tax=Mesorhizobium sp. TaxID=1871066 RepID=UPI0025C4ECD6|nr:sugar ABC transporter substrate-binding protein [Mesorhizobium sp.]